MHNAYIQRDAFPEELVLKPVETDEELRLANDLMAKVHSLDYFTALNWLERCGGGYPGFRREHTRIALWNGELAASLRINTETIRLGEARLKMGGICWVTTSPRHRQKGICRALMWDTLEYMKKHNYHVSMLFGIPNFYHRFGFATTLADYAIIVDAVEALGPREVTLRVREAKPGDIPAIQRIHVGNDAAVACSLLRSSAHITNKWERYKDTRVLTNGQGKVVAYFSPHRDSDQLRIEEVGVADPAFCGEVLVACAQMAGDEAVGRVRFLAPPPHAFARYLLQYKSIHEMRVVRDCGGMMAFIQVGEALENLIPEWESLLAKSPLREKRVEVTLLVDRAPFRIRANRGAIDVAQTSGTSKVGLTTADLIHVVTGYRYLDDILGGRPRVVRPDAREFLAALFPKRTPYVWMHDRF